MTAVASCSSTTRTPDDVRALLAAGAVLFERSDFAFGARGDLAGMVWLLGPDGLQRFQSLRPTPPLELARAFPDGGYYVSRSDWGADADWLAFDCGPHGVMNGRTRPCRRPLLRARGRRPTDIGRSGDLHLSWPRAQRLPPRSSAQYAYRRRTVVLGAGIGSLSVDRRRHHAG